MTAYAGGPSRQPILWDVGTSILMFCGASIFVILWGGVYLQVVEASRGMPGLRVIDGTTMVALGIGAGDASRKVLEQAENPEARLNETRGGLGMALPIARRVVEQLGGRVWSSATERAIGSIALVLPVREHTP